MTPCSIGSALEHKSAVGHGGEDESSSGTGSFLSVQAGLSLSLALQAS